MSPSCFCSWHLGYLERLDTWKHPCSRRLSNKVWKFKATHARLGYQGCSIFNSQSDTIFAHSSTASPAQTCLSVVTLCPAGASQPWHRSAAWIFTFFIRNNSHLLREQVETGGGKKIKYLQTLSWNVCLRSTSYSWYYTCHLCSMCCLPARLGQQGITFYRGFSFIPPKSLGRLLSICQGM